MHLLKAENFLWFQSDFEPPHYLQSVRTYLMNFSVEVARHLYEIKSYCIKPELLDISKEDIKHLGCH